MHKLSHREELVKFFILFFDFFASVQNNLRSTERRTVTQSHTRFGLRLIAKGETPKYKNINFSKGNHQME